jgi:cytochrome c biogenesis protein CcdA
MEIANLSLAFSAGLLAVLSPCSLPMLPSYLSYFLNLEKNKNSLSSALGFGFITVAGFLTIFLVIGILPSYAINIIATRIELVSPFIGLILIIIGLSHFFSYIFYKIPVINIFIPKGTGFKAFYVYGLGYGAASMACSFPIFLLLVLQSASVSGISSMLLTFLAYGLGAATIIVPLSLTLTLGKEIIYQKLIIAIPHIKKINSIILIIAGLYLILYSLN